MDGEMITHPKLRLASESRSGASRLPRSIARTLRAFRTILRVKPDVVIGYSFLPAAVGALLAAKVTGALSIYQMCGGPAELAHGGLGSDAPDRLISEVPPRWQKPLERAALALCGFFDGIVVRGHRAKAYLETHSQARNIVIIPGSVDAQRFVAGSGVRDCDIAFLGRFVPDKQPHLLVDVVAEVAKNRPALRCVFAGDGPLLESTRTRAEDLGVKRNIEFPGRIEDTEELLRSAKVFLLTSRSEGLSIALAEAMMAGAVPVASDVGDLRELIRDGITGWLIVPGDVESYAARITGLLENGQTWLNFSENARRAAVQNNSVENVTDKWQQFLVDLVSDS